MAVFLLLLMAMDMGFRRITWYYLLYRLNLYLALYHKICGPVWIRTNLFSKGADWLVIFGVCFCLNGWIEVFYCSFRVLLTRVPYMVQVLVQGAGLINLEPVIEISTAHVPICKKGILGWWKCMVLLCLHFK